MTEKTSFGIVSLIFLILSIFKMFRIVCKNEQDDDNDKEMSHTENNEQTTREGSLSRIRKRQQQIRILKRTDSESTTANLLSLRVTEPIDFRSLVVYRETRRRHFWKSVLDYAITFNSSFLIVGGLSESYLYGVRMFGNIISVCIGHLYCSLVVYPFMYSLDARCRTPYDYLKLRYNNRDCPKYVCLAAGVFYYFSFLSLYLWGCAAILNLLVPELDLHVANVVLGVFSLVGTLFGGFTQSAKINIGQFLLAFFGIVAAMVLTLNTTGMVESFDKMWNFARDFNRTTFFDPSIDLTTRYTILNQLVSLPLPWCSKLALFLPNYLRYRSIRSKSDSRALFLSSLPLTVLINSILIVAGGLFCFVHLYGCDPHKLGQVPNKNQVGIYWLHAILSSQAPTLSGLVFACIVYQTIVQHSMGVAQISQTLNDEIAAKMKLADGWRRKCLEGVISIAIGLASIPYSGAFQLSRNTMLSLFYVFNNSLNSPILGLFLLSMFNPYANCFGAVAAFVLNLAINTWIVLGNLVFSHTKSQEFEHHTSRCSNATTLLYSRMNEYYPKNEILYLAYSIAPIWYCLFSVLFSFIVGSLLSVVYSLVTTRSFDADNSFRSERRKLMFFYRMKNHF